MIRNTINALSGPTAFALCFLWLVWLVATSLWPVAFWFDVRDVHVHDAREGEPVLMAVDRTIVRQFEGKYFVQVRLVKADGTMGVVECPGYGGGPYYVGSELPTPLTLDWWASNKCDLPVGKYRAVTTWHVMPTIPVLPTKKITVLSNVFEIHPKDAEQ